MLRAIIFLLMALFLSACSTTHFEHPNATGTYHSKAQQCVPYARKVSGINIYGDAYTWWDRAAYTYRRGQQPRVGAVLVLANTKKMRYGHLAVVKDVISPRQINVTHSNWGNNSKNRRIIYESMRVEDISPANDWTRLRFWNYEENVFGFPYEALGFIYK